MKNAVKQKKEIQKRRKGRERECAMEKKIKKSGKEMCRREKRVKTGNKNKC